MGTKPLRSKAENIQGNVGSCAHGEQYDCAEFTRFSTAHRFVTGTQLLWTDDERNDKVGDGRMTLARCCQSYIGMRLLGCIVMVV